ncbi:MAG: glutathione S-transferase family protein, partial [Pseudomonadales bacterium]
GFMGMERSDAKAAEYLAQLDRPLRVLEGELTGREYLLGERFTVADLNVASVFAWAGMAGLDLTPYPQVGAWLTRCLARPALARANAR